MFDSRNPGMLVLRATALSQRRTIRRTFEDAGGGVAAVPRGSRRHRRVPRSCGPASAVRRTCLRMPFSALALHAQAAQPEAGSGDLSTHTDIVRLVLEA